MTARATMPVEPLLGRRPMARTARVTLFSREVRERLSGAAVEVLLSRAKVISEGKRAQAATSGAFFGSTMFTIDLEAVRDVVRETCDAATARRIAEQMRADPLVARRCQRLALAEAARLAGAPLGAHNLEVRVRAQGTLVYVDVDVEAGPR